MMWGGGGCGFVVVVVWGFIFFLHGLNQSPDLA